MLSVLVLSLTISQSSAASSEPVVAFKALRLERPLLFEAPALPPFPQNLPGRPLDVPEDKATCINADGADLGPGTFFPKPWADALRERNIAAGMLQPKAQATLDALSGLALVGMAANGEAVSADAAAEAARVRVEGPSFWDYLPPVAGALAAGLVIGFVGAVALAR